MDDDDNAGRRIIISIDEGLKKDAEALAEMKGLSLTSLIRDALVRYVKEEYYKKAEGLANIEDRFASGVLRELWPYLSKLDVIEKKLDRVKDGKSEIVYRKKSKNDKSENFPKVPGLHYTVDGENVVYEDGSIYNLHLGAWLVTKEDVAKWRRKKEKEKRKKKIMGWRWDSEGEISFIPLWK